MGRGTVGRGVEGGMGRREGEGREKKDITEEWRRGGR